MSCQWLSFLVIINFCNSALIQGFKINTAGERSSIVSYFKLEYNKIINSTQHAFFYAERAALIEAAIFEAKEHALHMQADRSNKPVRR